MFDAKIPTDYARELGARLRALRLQRNIPQGELARRAGISRPTLGALEGRGRGTLETLVRVIYALGREEELELLLGPDPPSTLAELAPIRPPRQRARP